MLILYFTRTWLKCRDFLALSFITKRFKTNRRYFSGFDMVKAGRFGTGFILPFMHRWTNPQ